MSQISHESIVIEQPGASEEDDKVQVYGSTLSNTQSPVKSRQSSNYPEGDYGEDRKEHKPTSLLLPSPSSNRKASTHSDDTHVTTRSFADSNSWMQHPKIRENWKVVLGAVMLTLIGSVLFFVGVGIVASPSRGMHCLVFFIGGLLCLIPGAYHLVYIYLALWGCEGYSLYDLPVFN